MAIRCPACQHAIELTGAKPGHYRPACPACHATFDLLIANDPNEPPRATAIAPKPPSRAEITAAAPAQLGPPGPTGAPSNAPVDRTHFVAGAPALAYDDLHGRLGGYEIIRKVGQGGIGSVYLARQRSLDRDVALKTLSPTLADDPQFVARFAREAHAAARLTHPNVIQIYDIGQDKGTNFYSMELVDGTTLARVVEREGRLDPITAASYALQAARGLAYAHDRGLIHRDVKPDNLLLNDAGVVKVADLGLVTRAGAPDPGGPSSAGAAAATATQFNVGMGTPAYMAPEQARDAAQVDARADVYALGCTLYDLVTGRPPFSGRSAIEVIAKHQTEPLTPPETLVAGLPRGLSEIIGNMTAKDPAARYASMGEVVRAFEDFLGIAGDGGARASQDDVKRVEVAVAQFNAAPFARVRRNGILAFFVAALIAFAIGSLTLTPWLAGGAVAFAVLATLAYQLVVGLKQRKILFAKVRQLISGASVGDWLTWLVAAALAVALLYLFGQLWIWVGVAVLAGFVGASFHFGVDGVVAVQREEPVRDVERLARALRVRGVDEEAIRGLVARYGGRDWEAFYEALFGYEAKLRARRSHGKGERRRDRRHGAWRDGAIAWIDAKLDARKADRERRLLARVEASALEARGVRATDANRHARDAASHGVERAAETVAPGTSTAAPPSAAVPQPAWVDAKPAVAERLEGYERTGYLRRRYGGPLDVLLGRRVRFLLAAVLLLGAGRWVQLNGVATAFEEVRDVGADVRRTGAAIDRKLDTAAREGTSVADGAATDLTGGPRGTVPLRVPGVPDRVCDAVGSWNGLACGALLLVSVPLWGHLMSVTVLLGCAVALAGPGHALPVIGPTPWWLALGLGGGAALLGMLFLRRTVE